MRNKLMAIAAMLAVMISMTGIAMAYNINLVGVPGNPVRLSVGQSVTLDAEVNTLLDDPALPHAIILDPKHAGNNPEIGCITSGCNKPDITATVVPGKIPFSATSDPFTQNGVLNVTLSATPVSAIGTRYSVILYTCDSTTGNCQTNDVEMASASRTFKSIPEFPTVALPVAAVIGLVFFLQNRKNKKE